MARPAEIFSRYDERLPTVETVTYPSGQSTSTVYETPTRHVTVVKPASISTPKVVPRPRTNYSSYSYRGSSAILGTAEYQYLGSGPRIVVRGDTGYTCDDVDFSDDPSGVIARAVNGAIAKLRSDDALNIAIVAGELSQTAALVSSSMTRIAKMVKAFRMKTDDQTWRYLQRELGRWWNPNRGDRMHYYRQQKNGQGVLDAWLEMQYGWKPMVSDVHSSMVTLYDNMNAGKNLSHILCRKRAREKFRSNQKMADVLGSRFNWRVLNNVSATATFHYTLDDPIRAQVGGLGLNDPLLLGWEKTPYSFVVDWFFPVGNFLQARSADYGWRFEGGSVSNLAKMEATGEMVSASGSNGAANVNISQTRPAKARGHRFYRVVQPNNVPPTAIPPSLKNPFTATHVANAFALLVGAFRK